MSLATRIAQEFNTVRTEFIPVTEAPTGNIVGTTDTQTVTEKTLSDGTKFETDALAMLHATSLYF